MNAKSLIWIGMFVGSTVGSYIPTLFGAGFLSLWSVFLSAAGAIAGVWAGYKLANW